MASNLTNGSHTLTNYCAYIDSKTGDKRIGHLDRGTQTIQPLAFASGTYLSNLYQVIQAGEDGIIACEEPISRSEVQLLPPINDRDILCVGKNYSDHAKEFHASGFDSSDKVDQPTHPVIFSKRFSSIIADGEEIYPHPKFSQTVDYEGELGVVIGKAGFRIGEAEAMDHVWGYTIVNDMTARERQRDHKQFYIGKSPDTFCPMGPVAVPAHKLDKVLRVQTHVNGELRQSATTEQLIFSIPVLIMTMSEGQTLMPGDVLATGTPAGVGIGRTPPVYLKSGDEVSVSITGLGKLTNRIASVGSQNPTPARIERLTSQDVPSTRDQQGLRKVGDKALHVKEAGIDSGPPAIFVHGLGGTMDYWTPLLHSTNLNSAYKCYLLDLEGHGLSPTVPQSKLSIASFAADVKALCTEASITTDLTILAHSMGCLVAMRFTLDNPGMVSKLILVGPPPSPLPEAGSKASHARAALVRAKGMGAVVDAVSTAGTSEKTKSSNTVALSAVRLSLLGQNAEGYAKACTALAEATSELEVSKMQAKTMIVTGSEDKISPMQVCEGYKEKMPGVVGVEVLPDVGHWHVLEDPVGVSKAVAQIL
ncbi:uncharacterized protein LTR77_005261 [Saxophila tyrrhenica]|uniref:Fumarylacetoacetate hydrolase n=1 Tax=Saxophila tyrrhenica TaxID=1690608 RepID=A0AAV9PCB8_9PEZI|nr:hypothetical protein LTR77_005261 [Saxophila tyrrhenica]